MSRIHPCRPSTPSMTSGVTLDAGGPQANEAFAVPRQSIAAGPAIKDSSKREGLPAVRISVIERVHARRANNYRRTGADLILQDPHRGAAGHFRRTDFLLKRELSRGPE